MSYDPTWSTEEWQKVCYETNLSGKSLQENKYMNPTMLSLMVQHKCQNGNSNVPPMRAEYLEDLDQWECSTLISMIIPSLASLSLSRLRLFLAAQPGVSHTEHFYLSSQPSQSHLQERSSQLNSGETKGVYRLDLENVNIQCASSMSVWLKYWIIYSENWGDNGRQHNSWCVGADIQISGPDLS